MWKSRKDQKRRRRKDEFAPALPAEPAFERPTDEAYLRQRRPELYGRSPSGSWADARTPRTPPAGEAPEFIDPGSYALHNHVIPLMEGRSLPVGSVGGASADLDAAPGPSGSGSPGPAPGGLAD